MKNNNVTGKINLFLITTSFFSSYALSEITLDGSMGTPGALAGPDYQITENLGQRAGSNLFHSFGKFNLNSAESATLRGSAGIKNVISRVTGGQPSTIDGAFRSTIPGANVYFLNPSGVVFGKNASLDVQGSFHASTANYLIFKDGVKFETELTNTHPILTTARPEAFGFLEDAPASITVSGGNNKVLEVPEDATLSFIGGNINIENRSLYAPSGQIILASTGSVGEFVINESGIDTSSFTKGGNIHLSHAANTPITTIKNDIQIADIDVSADSAGKVVIRGGQMVMDNASIRSNTTSKEGAGIDIGLTGDLTINGIAETSNIEKISQSGITANALGEGHAGNILLNVGSLKLTDKTRIDSSTQSSGHGGNIQIKANSILLKGNDHKVAAKLITKTTGSGSVGNISITATDKLEINKAEISATTFGAGHAGNIEIESPSIEMMGINSNISTETDALASGNAGHIAIQSENLKMLDGTKLKTRTAGSGLGGIIAVNSSTISLSGLKTGFVTDASANRANNAGNIVVNSGSLNLDSKASIDSVTFSEAVGNGGNIILNVNHITLEESTIKADTFGSANAGNIEINTNTLELSNNSAITNSTFDTGQASNIEIKADNISLNDSGIQSNSLSHFTIDNNTTIAMSGNIKIDINNELRLDNQSAISVSTEKANAGLIEIKNGKQLRLSHSKITTSVANGTGSGGNITIDTPIVALDSSRIIAQAQKGIGGNISISGFLFQSPSSTVDASSKFNQDGELNLKPETDLINSLTVLPGSMLNAQEKINDHCSPQSGAKKNSFVIKNRGGIPLSPGNLTPSTSMDFSSTLQNHLPQELNNKTHTRLPTVSSKNVPCVQ